MVSEIAGIYIFPAFMATEEYVKKTKKYNSGKKNLEFPWSTIWGTLLQ